MIICILHPGSGGYSETFIRAHIERLPANVKTWTRIPQFSRPILPAVFKRPKNSEDLKVKLVLVLDLIKKAALGLFLKSVKMDAVLAEYGPSGVAAMRVCDRKGVPLIVHFHGADAYKYDILEEHGEAYKRMFHVARAIIAVSSDMERQLIDLGAPKAKVFYNPYGVDTSIFKGGDPGLAPPVFVAVGRFTDKKAPHLTLLAFKKVLEQCPEARLIMIGDGLLWDACKQMASASGIGDAVDFTGPMSPKDVAAAMQGARAFVQHSLRPGDGDSEGTPVAVLEAGASGLPVVATRHAGIKDVVIEGETGFLVEERDVQNMARHMIELAKNPKLAADMGKRARERIEAEFSMEKSIAGLWEIIQEAAK